MLISLMDCEYNLITKVNFFLKKRPLKYVSFNRLYKDLLQRGFFKDERDIALSGTCDGYQIFEQRTDDCWVILLINNNLHPFIRVKKENLLVTMIIPGPRSPKNFNSFLCPLIKELQELEGIANFNI